MSETTDHFSSDEEIELAIQEVGQAIGAQKAILFGSMGRGTHDRRSDVDVVFVKETAARFVERSKEPLGLLWQRLRGRGLDVLVYTPSEFDRMSAEGNRFINHIMSEGRILYVA